MRPETLWGWSRWSHRRRVPLLARFFKAVTFLIYNAILPPEAEVGECSLKHYGLGVVIHPNVTIGSNVCIYHRVTVAGETWVGSPHRIVIEDDVTIGAGAAIVPKADTGLTLGTGAVIGAGAVVTRDVLAGETVVGVPAKPLKCRSDAALTPSRIAGTGAK